LLTACATQSVTQPERKTTSHLDTWTPTQPPRQEKHGFSHLSTLDQYIAAWNDHDAAAAAGFLDEKVEYFDATTAEPQIGRRNAQKNIIQAFITAVPDLVWRRDASSPIVSADGTAFQWTLSGTNTGNWSDGTKATGRKFSIHGATLMRFAADEKIIYQGDYYDAYGFYKQLGLAQ
jgi:ketosteroid isomerase-like protein